MKKYPCWLSISVDCWSQVIVDLSWLLISVNCWSQLIVDLSWLSISVDCWSQLVVDLMMTCDVQVTFGDSLMTLWWLYGDFLVTFWWLMMTHDDLWCSFMNDLMPIWGFDHWLTDWLTDLLTHGQTTLVVKSLAWLKSQSYLVIHSALGMLSMNQFKVLPPITLFTNKLYKLSHNWDKCLAQTNKCALTLNLKPIPIIKPIIFKNINDVIN